MPTEKDRIVSYALASCYVVSAAVIIAIYREPLAALARSVFPKERFVSARTIPGKLGRDIREALDNGK